jgi:hypothetical protein
MSLDKCLPNNDMSAKVVFGQMVFDQKALHHFNTLTSI